MLRKVILSALTVSLVFGAINSTFAFANSSQNGILNDSQINIEAHSTRGIVVEMMEDGRIYVVGSGFQDEIILDIEDAQIIDEKTGELVDAGSIAEGEEVIVFYSGVMTRSMPPQGFATGVLVNLTDDVMVENKLNSILERATVTSIEDEFLMVKTEADEQEIRLITIETKVYDMVTGELAKLNSISEGDTVLVNYGPTMTFSMPPQTNAIQIFINVDNEEAASLKMTALREVESSESSVSFLNINEDYIITFNEDTEITDIDGKTLKYSDVNIGNGILVWSPFMTASFPGLATATKAVVITVDKNVNSNNTTENNGYAEQENENQESNENIENNEITGNMINVSSNSITLSASSTVGTRTIEGGLPTQHGGVLMLPVRKIAEAYGFEVSFNDEAKQVQLTKGNDFSINSPIYEHIWAFEQHEGSLVSFKLNESVFEYFLSDEPINLQNGNTFVLINDTAYAPVEFFELVFEAQVNRI